MPDSQVDHFRPPNEPARTLYDAFLAETSKRCSRTVPEWVAAERNAMWVAARDYAQQYGMPVPTLADVEHAEGMAYGHIDYGTKWAYSLAEIMTASQKEANDA